MPYERKGKTVYKKEGGHLKSKGTSTTVAKAKSHERVLQAVEHGWKPSKKKWHFIFILLFNSPLYELFKFYLTNNVYRYILYL